MQVCGINDEYNDGRNLDGFSAVETISKIDTEEGRQALIEIFRKKNRDFKLIIPDYFQAVIKGDENSAQACKFMDIAIKHGLDFNIAYYLEVD